MNKLEAIEKAIEIIHTQRKGYRKDLIEKVGRILVDESVNDEELIIKAGKSFVDELAKRGLISQGVTASDNHPNDFKRTWGIVAEKVDEYRRLFSREISEESRRKGRYLYSIGVR